MGSKHIFFVSVCCSLRFWCCSVLLVSSFRFHSSFFLLDFTQNSTLPVLSVSPFSFCATHAPKHSPFLSLSHSRFLVPPCINPPPSFSHFHNYTLHTLTGWGERERPKDRSLGLYAHTRCLTICLFSGHHTN